MIIMRSLLLMVFVSLVQVLAAQNAIVYGVVTDETTGETLVGVAVQVSSTQGEITDLDGKYRLELPPGQYTLTFSYLGYDKFKKTLNLKSDDVKELNVKMLQTSQNLGVVVVTASQYEKNIAEETVSVDVLSSELVKNTNSRDVGDIVAKTPGVQVLDGQISIRGGSSYSYGVGSRTAVLVDGMSIASADLGDVQLKQAPLEDVEQIEVIKGASSVIYGSSALNGVVNIRTAWPTSIEPETQFNFYYGVYDRPPRPELKWWKGGVPNFTGFTVNHKRRFGNLQFITGANMDYVNSYLEEGNEFRFRYNFKTRYQLKKDPRFSFGLNGTVNKENNGRFFISQDLDSNAYRIAQGSDDSYTKTNLNPHFQFIDDKGNKYTFKFQWFNVFRVGNGEDINASANSFSVENQYQKNFKDLIVLTVGTPFTAGVSKSNLYDGKRVNLSAAAYAQAELKYKRLSLVGGVRYEMNSVDTVVVTTIPVFRSGLNFRAGKATYLRASWGQAYRVPSIAERFISEDILGSIIIWPNSKLKVEKSWSTEIGVKQLIKVKKWLAFVDFSVFWMEYENFVEYQFEVLTPGNGLDEWGNIVDYYDRDRIILELNPDHVDSLKKTFAVALFPQNQPKARVAGYEVSFMSQGELGPVTFRSLIGYTYTYPRKASPEDDLSFTQYSKDFFKDMFRRIPQDEAINKVLLFRTRHLLRGDIELKYEKYSAGFTVAYGSFPEQIPEEFKSAISLISKDANAVNDYVAKHLKGDWVFGLRAAYQATDKLKVSFIVSNLTNHEYFLRPGKLEPPRSYTFQFRFTL